MTRAIAIAAALSAGVVSLAAQTQFRAGTDTVQVYATVKLKDGTIAHDLTREDFELRDDGKPREITVFSRSIQPLSVALVLDHSGSTDRDFEQVRFAAQDFVGRLLRADRASIRTLSWNCLDFTDDRRALLGMLRLQLPGDSGSPIWSTMDATMTALAGEPGRRVILLFSDGEDNQALAGTFPSPPRSAAPDPFSVCQAAAETDQRSIGDVTRRLEREGVMLYTVGLESIGGDSDFGLGDLFRLAQRSGAEYRRLKSVEDVRSAFVSIADELHLQYLLGFVPAAFDGKRHEIDVRVRRPGVTVRARKAYVATRAGG